MSEEQFPRLGSCHLTFESIILIMHADRSFRGPIDFSSSLYRAACNDYKKEEKDSPLFTSTGEPKLRIRAFQPMTIIRL